MQHMTKPCDQCGKQMVHWCVFSFSDFDTEDHYKRFWWCGCGHKQQDRLSTTQVLTELWELVNPS